VHFIRDIWATFSGFYVREKGALANLVYTSHVTVVRGL